MAQRQIVLDTETTGLDTASGHRIIEIGCVELLDRKHTRRHYHRYIDPQREVDAGALEVHGISNEFLAGKPLFADIVDEFIEFIAGAELIIHNAPFDLGFLDYELSLLGHKIASVTGVCTVVDTLALARRKHPGQRNSLDALCKRYQVDNSGRELHGALLDSEILADVYLRMTGGQSALALQSEEGSAARGAVTESAPRCVRNGPLPVIAANSEETTAHDQLLLSIREAAGECAWLAE